MHTSSRILLALVSLLFASGASARVDWAFEEGDAYSRVLCRLASQSSGARKDHLTVEADEEGRGPVLSCRLENYEITVENDLLEETPIPSFQKLVWEPIEDGVKRRRYFVIPEVCFEASGTWRCRKQVHEKTNTFLVELPTTCPYRVKIGAIPVVGTCVDNRTPPPLDVSGTMLLDDGEVTSNPFSFHPLLDVDGAHYRDLAVVDVKCPPEPPKEKLCGNGVVDPGELCDDGNNTPDDECSNQCRPPEHEPVCGDGVVDPGEICDDGNKVDGDACNNQCRPPTVNPVCGDGVVDPGEICDDGNQIDDDGCTNECQTNIVVPFCGDDIVQPGLGETCEPGMVLAPVGGGVPDRVCADDCSYCGDGVVQPAEACDDGNDVDDDDCSNQCALPDYRFCAMFRDPSFSRDQQGHPRLKANGRMEAIDVSVAAPSDDLVVDIGQEHVIVHASTQEEGTIFERAFPAGSLQYYERSGNRGFEHDAGSQDNLVLKIHGNHTRFNLELPGDARMDALLDRVEAGEVHSRLVEFQIRFEDERIICRAATVWDCKDTGERGHCKGQLQ